MNEMVRIPLHLRYVTVKKFAELTGYTEKAVNAKTERGVWLEGKHYRIAPDGRKLIDLEEFERWVEHRTQVSTSTDALYV